MDDIKNLPTGFQRGSIAWVGTIGDDSNTQDHSLRAPPPLSTKLTKFARVGYACHSACGEMRKEFFGLTASVDLADMKEE